MGGRGGMSNTEATERTRDFMEAMTRAGLKPTKSLEEATKIMKDNQLMNQASKQQSKYMYPSHLADYQRGFYKTANNYSKKGYQKEKQELLKKIANNPEKIRTITENAQKKYKVKMREYESQMNKAVAEKDYQSASKKLHETFGKFQAANFINWSIK